MNRQIDFRTKEENNIESEPKGGKATPLRSTRSKHSYTKAVQIIGIQDFQSAASARPLYPKHGRARSHTDYWR